MQRALLKYGFSNFTLEILEYCNKKNAIEREQHYLDLLKPKYNIVKSAKSTLGYKHTEESLEKMRRFILSDEVRIRKQMSTLNASESNKKSIVVYNTTRKETQNFTSITEAARIIGFSKSAVSQALLENRLLKKIYIIKTK